MGACLSLVLPGGPAPEIRTVGMSLQGVGLGVDIFTRCPETDCDSHMQVRDLGLSFRSISERFLRLFNTSRTPASIREKWRNMVHRRHPHYGASPGAPTELVLSLSLFRICLLAVVAVFLPAAVCREERGNTLLGAQRRPTGVWLGLCRCTTSVLMATCCVCWLPALGSATRVAGG